ncbi:acyltransferase family protein [Paenibacillus sp. NPDC056579]|uniref:acyltransferase family protein n=1 Tax=Paenibacillus sp. NPDC056579 TaxID=3345871 RepID=UPI0036A9FE27
MRYDELDSIRGLAATSVLLAHISIILPDVYFFEKFKNTPLHIFWFGHESVILFFILSGFVLSLPYINNKQLRYGDYLIRRFCRIYIPSMVSVLIALCILSLYSGRLEGLSDWFNGLWVHTPTFYTMLNNIFLLGGMDNKSVNPVLWSLVHEVRISILFPFIMFILVRTAMKTNFIMMLCIPLAYLGMAIIGLKGFGFDYTMYISGYSSYIMTPYYIGFFILGAWLAMNREAIRMRIINLSSALKMLLLAAGLIAYSYDWIVLPGVDVIHNFVLNDWAAALGGSIFIVLALNSKTLGNVLTFRPVHFVGKISYSLYLYHMVILLTLIYIFHNKWSMSLVLSIGFVLSFVVAGVMYYAVEVPAVKVGRLLTKKSSGSGNRDEKMAREKGSYIQTN